MKNFTRLPRFGQHTYTLWQNSTFSIFSKLEREAQGLNDVMALERKLEQLEMEIAQGDWFPSTSSGKQISPNALRGRITRFLAESGMTQTEFLRKASINPGSYNKFKKPGYYEPVVGVL